MNLIPTMKAYANRVAARFGFRIERIVDYGEYQLDVFRLLVEQLGPGEPEFFLVQVGANDGKTADPVYPYIKTYHWRGLLLEPQPDVFQRLVETYADEPQLILENAALTHEDGAVPFFTVMEGSNLGSFDRDALKERILDGSEIIETVVIGTTFQSLVEKHSLERIDLLVVDTEGFDYEATKLILEAGFKPRLLRYEHLHLSPSDRRACAAMLADLGYRLLRDGIDTIAFRES